MFRLLGISVVGALLFLTPSHVLAADQPSRKASVSGMVVDKDDHGLAGVDLTMQVLSLDPVPKLVYSGRAISGPGGAFRIENLPPGNLTLHASKGRLVGSLDSTLENGKNTELGRTVLFVPERFELSVKFGLGKDSYEHEVKTVVTVDEPFLQKDRKGEKGFYLASGVVLPPTRGKYTLVLTHIDWSSSVSSETGATKLRMEPGKTQTWGFAGGVARFYSVTLTRIEDKP